MAVTLIQETHEGTTARTPKPPAEGIRAIVGDAAAVGHDVAKANADGAEAIVDAARISASPIGGTQHGTAGPEGGGTGLEPNLTSEHKAKQLAEQERLAGAGVVPVDGRPPER
ncbi:MAG: hypothetical protein ACLQD9_04035 [Thermoplasmata archaeon]